MKRALKRQLLVDHYLDFYSTAVAMLKDDDDAKDAVQEALVRTLVRTGIDDPCRYCMRTLKHLCVDTLRRKQRLQRLDGMELLAELDSDEIINIVCDKKEKLPAAERALLDLHYEEGYTLPEVAAIAGVSLATLKRLLADIRNRLKNEIEHEI